jgi:hypothetical protein
MSWLIRRFAEGDGAGIGEGEGQVKEEDEQEGKVERETWRRGAYGMWDMGCGMWGW